MAKKRTREQKIKAAQFRSAFVYEPASPTLPLPSAKPPQPVPATPAPPSVRRDFVKTLVSTLIVLGVLLFIFVYTRIL